MNRSDRVLDPISAYDKMGASYALIAERRRAYLDAVDELIIERIPSGSQSLLDAGAGDGRRALKIAGRIGVSRVVLVDPSAAMRRLILDRYEVWAESLEGMGAHTEVRCHLVLVEHPGTLELAT